MIGRTRADYAQNRFANSLRVRVQLHPNYPLMLQQGLSHVI